MRGHTRKCTAKENLDAVASVPFINGWVHLLRSVS